MKDKQNIGTCLVLVNSERKILVGKRKNAYKAGMYGLPGGRIEVNEPMSQAVAREVLEETGLDLDSFDYVGAVRENQGDYDFIHFVFIAEISDDQKPELKEPEKCEGWKWVDFDFIDKHESEILPGHVAGIGLFRDKKRLSDLLK